MLEALVLLFGVYVFVHGSICLSFGLLAASARERWSPFVGWRRARHTWLMLTGPKVRGDARFGH
jgi:hypothetical protein